MVHLKQYVFVAIILAVVLAGFKLYPPKEETPLVKKIAPHFYRNPLTDISRINLKVFYAVPQNKIPLEGWPALLEPVLVDSEKFHKVQFRGISELHYDIASQPFLLERESGFYDTGNTDRGNPEGLKNIFSEIKRRVPGIFEPAGGAFTVVAIVYEGVGASGTDGAMILSRTFLSDGQYRDFRSSLFYHEFGHTLGLPDRYDLEHSIPYSNDIMGAGRRKSIELTYIDMELLREMGL